MATTRSRLPLAFGARLSDTLFGAQIQMFENQLHLSKQIRRTTIRIAPRHFFAPCFLARMRLVPRANLGHPVPWVRRAPLGRSGPKAKRVPKARKAIRAKLGRKELSVRVVKPDWLGRKVHKV